MAARDSALRILYYSAGKDPRRRSPIPRKLARSGGDYEVPVGETIVGVLQRRGIAVRTSCELGYCGACLTPYLAGEPDHRDQVLEGNRRQRYVLICCSRAKTPVLVLDL